MIDKKIQNTIVIGIPTIFVILVVLLIFQQKKISELKKIIMPSVGTGQSSSLDANGQDQNLIPLSVAEQKKTELANNTREIDGTVVSVSGKVIKVSADLIDLGRIKEATSEDESTFAKAKKEFTVATNDGTKFFGNKLADIKKGDSIRVHAEDSVYNQANIIATVIISPVVSEDAAQNSGPKFVSGKITSIGNDVITIQTTNTKGNKGDIYKVNVENETKYTQTDVSSDPPKITNINLSSLKTDDSVAAIASDPIGDRKEFDAIEINLITGSPPKK